MDEPDGLWWFSARAVPLFFLMIASTFLASCTYLGDSEISENLAPVHVSPAPGIYSDPNQEILIESPDSGVAIKFNLYGANLRTNGSFETYSAPLHLAGSGVVELRAYSVRSGGRSPVDSVQYDFPIPWNSLSTVSWGTLSSGRLSYRTVTIGTQTWMAENLNDAGPSGKIGTCTRSDTVYCREYGRNYTWAEAMGIDDGYNSSRWGGSERLHQGVCPSGWHVPSDSEWNTLFSWVNGITNAVTPGRFLKSSDGWSNARGLDQFGFRVLPSGDDNFPPNGDKCAGEYLTASESSSTISKSWEFTCGSDSIWRTTGWKGNRRSLRCVKDP